MTGSNLVGPTRAGATDGSAGIVCTRRVARLISAAALVLVAVAGEAVGQETRPAGGSLYLDSRHWAVAAARRLEAAGLAPHGYDTGQRTPTRGEVLRVLRTAAERAPGRAPGWEPLIAGWLERLLEEFPGLDYAGSGSRHAVHEIHAGAGFERVRGRMRTGLGYEDEGWIPEADWQGPTPWPDESGGVAAVAWTLALPGAGFQVYPVLHDGGLRLEALQATAALGRVGFWAGRRAPGYGAGVGGAVVLTGAVEFDGAGLALLEPVRLPGLLRHVGAIRFETYLSRVDENGPRNDPWFWAARGSISPHPRIRLGVSRGALFAGESDHELVGSPPITLRNIGYLLIGKHAGQYGEFENHIVAVDLRVRPPVGSMPLALYLEWGFADSAGSITNVPARIAGAELAALPGMPQVGIGVERTSFAPSCCSNPIWYRNWIFWGGWADRGQPLGHPLGGHGVEWLAHASADLLDAALRLEMRAFTRDRGEENLYAPAWLGRSNGGELHASWRVREGVELSVGGTAEFRGGDSSTSELRAGVRLLR